MIIKDLFTVPELRRDPEDILYVFNHMILKIANEAVVDEGMRGQHCEHARTHGDKSRGRLLRQELTEIEALVHCNFPPLSHPGTETIIRKVLNHRFDGGKWHFTHTTGHSTLTAARYYADTTIRAKHPFLVYISILIINDDTLDKADSQSDSASKQAPSLPPRPTPGSRLAPVAGVQSLALRRP